MNPVMDPNLSTLRAEPSDGNEDASSWISVCPRGLWRVQQNQIHINTQSAGVLQHPGLGSVCQVRVQLKTGASDIQKAGLGQECDQSLASPLDDSVPASSTTRCLSSVLQVPLDAWTTVTVGEGRCDITEECLKRMTSGDICEIRLVPLESCHSISSDSDQPFSATVELNNFTSGKESWELSYREKMDGVKSHKERGSIRFRSGDVWGAADSYSRAVKFLISLYGHVKEAQTLQEESISQQSPSETLVLSAEEYKTMKAELHSNLSLCQLKLNQPDRARESAAKATELCPGGAKAWYRLGQACLRINELQEAKRAFRKLLALEPDSSVAIKGLKSVSIAEKEANKELASRLSKMFS